METNFYSLIRLLQQCKSENFILQGRQLHLYFLKKGVLSSAMNNLIQMYCRCGHVTDAWKVFDEVPLKTCFSWNTMIEGYMKSGHMKRSLELFESMPEKNDFSWNVVISGFAKAMQLEIARNLFHNMPRKNLIAWNSMIHGYARFGCPREAVRLFRDLTSDPLETCDAYILATVIGACTDILALGCGKQIHARIVMDEVEFDSVLGSSLINLYGKCGDLDSASHVLGMMAEPDDFSLSALITGFANYGRINDAKRVFDLKCSSCSVVWNSMIAGYITNNEELEALTIFNRMRRKGVQADTSTLTSVLSACCSLGILEHGKQLHSHAKKMGVLNEIVISSALIDAYYKCGSPNDASILFGELEAYDTILLNSMITVYSNCGRIDDAKYIFETMQTKSLISWNSMIVGLSQNGCSVEALHLFCKMNQLVIRMDKFSLASVISACARLTSLELGEQVFSRAIIIGLESDQIISTSLVDFYCKCGSVEYGRKLFDEMIKLDEISWNSMLMGYATNGLGNEVLTLFNEMLKASVRPTGITFTSVLSSCDHCGLVEEGRKWFCAMRRDYHIDPGIEHYSCMIGLFSRAGHLREAMSLIEQMPFEADASIWSSVLRGCVTHGDTYLGMKVAERIMEFDPENSGAYVQLSGMLASEGNWEGSELVRTLMREKQIQKSPGYSWASMKL